MTESSEIRQRFDAQFQDLERVAKEVQKEAGQGRFMEIMALEGVRRCMYALLELSEKVKKIESRGVQYRGVYQRSEDYKRGDLVTFEGSMWHATRDTIEEPGASKDWQLAVKKGRDA